MKTQNVNSYSLERFAKLMGEQYPNENSDNSKESLCEFARKSVVGAVYRVGASFTLDAIYLSALAASTYSLTEGMDSLESVTKGLSNFMTKLDASKLARVAAFVVGINFVDYKWDVTNKRLTNCPTSTALCHRNSQSL